MARFVFIAGGVMSGIGKGISTASIGAILKSRGFRTTCVKIDPYLNVDAGTMNPVEHGEVFVTDDGLECDQDIGNYERFLDENMYRHNYMTSGQVYQEVISKERALNYGGKCVETVPHIPEEVIRRIRKAAKKDKADFVLIEIGGTIGEYQNIIFFEAGRMMRLQSPDKVIFVVVSYLPTPRMIGEMKTKPTQHAVRALNSVGIQPDIIISRSAVPMDLQRKRKIASFCNISEDDIISAPDAQNIYEIPLNFEKEKLGERILLKFALSKNKQIKGGANWTNLRKKIHQNTKPLKIGIVGKYFSTGRFTLSDSYISVIEAVKHAAWHNNLKPEIKWLSADEYEKNPKKLSELDDLQGIIIPGGFGERGVEGKIQAIRHARRKGIPFLGLCYGMQLAVVEFARSVAGLRGAASTEINSKTPYPVISTLPEQEENLNDSKFGGTMRLGAYPCELKPNTMSAKAYKEKNIVERHRHRYEFNNDFREKFENLGLIVSGVNPQRNLVEIIELKNHPFFIGVQFHPEFKSRPFRPHPLFLEFVKATSKRKIKSR